MSYSEMYRAARWIADHLSFDERAEGVCVELVAHLCAVRSSAIRVEIARQREIARQMRAALAATRVEEVPTIEVRK